MPSILTEKAQAILNKFRNTPSLRFLFYIVFLALVSLRVSDYANIDLKYFWQKGHFFMLFLSAFPTALLIHSFCLIRWAGGFLLGVWLLFVGIQLYVLELFNYRISFGIISLAFETDAAEASTFFTPTVIAIFIAIIVASLIFVWGMNKLRKGARMQSWGLWLILVLMTGANALFAPSLPSVRETVTWPFGNMIEIGKITGTYWFQERPLMQSLKNLESATSVESQFTPSPEADGLTVFFHFGETARADHWTLNGYPRQTTPFAEEEHKNGNLVYFPKTLSFAAGTRLSCVGMLTPAKLADSFPKYGPFFDLFKKHGFSLHAFRSNQKADDQLYDSSLISLTKIFKSATTYEAGTSDKVVPPIKDYLSREKSPYRLLFYYGEGSHAPYLYDPKFARFLPDNMAPLDFGSTPEQLINRYDNSLYATDQFIKNVIDSLRDKCAVYVYASDHGEYLGEFGNYSHGNNLMCHPEMRYIPFFIWLSPPFQKAYPELTARLKANAARLPVVSHDYIFHTILSISSIKTPLIESELDLTSPQALPHQGKLPEDISEEFVFDSLMKKIPN